MERLFIAMPCTTFRRLEGEYGEAGRHNDQNYPTKGERFSPVMPYDTTRSKHRRKSIMLEKLN